MRGKLDRGGCIDSGVRIIPAHAGQTSSSSCSCCRPSDHPRACGANCLRLHRRFHLNGSSPRMRGKHRRFRCRSYSPRIIPAHAGQTYAADRAGIRWADHPRACGANALRKLNRNTSTGSSPRMRGKRLDCVRHSVHPRIIPAHAGQTPSLILLLDSLPDHPRACGANAALVFATSLDTGSSPRMRGKHVLPDCIPTQGRIIPAHAGQTPGLHLRRCRMPDHPRACGANAQGQQQRMTASGSSPRMRGKRMARPQHQAHSRIIPAHAGQTAWHRCHMVTQTDHPRACGANPA